MSKARILVVDDEANARIALAELLREEGYAVETAADGFKGLRKLEEHPPDLLLTDLEMPGLGGLELMDRAKLVDPEIGMVVMTAFGAIETAVAAMRRGAADYLPKPLDIDELVLVLDRVLGDRRLRAETHQLRTRLAPRHRQGNIIGSSPALSRLLQTVWQVAPSRASVLITGESGSGKELVAAAIHQQSSRSSGPFVKLHCAALAENVLESELFGHERGSFTGAERRREGRFEQASGGTLFLDEVGELSPAMQVKLLRVLQERELERVGGNQTVPIDVRLVAATHRDLPGLIRAGRFREDLYYRLNVVTLEMPPLRERRADVPALAVHFLRRYAAENDKPIEGLGDEALMALVAHDWPGNVRELEHVIERAVVVCRGREIALTDLGPALELPRAPAGCARPEVPGSTLHDLERYAILSTLAHTGGSTTKTAELLGVSTRKIQYKLREYAGNPEPAVALHGGGR